MTETPQASGHGIEKSKPFVLAGNYTVNWTATPDDKYGCFIGASLEREDGQFINEVLVSEILGDGTPMTGTTQLYNLETTSYYVDVTSGCGWSFTFSAGTQ